MATSLAPKEKRSIARPLKVLVPMIQHELTNANEAGLEHYRRAGELLLEAKEQVPHGSFGKWVNKNFKISATTAWRYMRLAERAEEAEADSGNSNFSPGGRIKSLLDATGETDQRRESRREKKKLWEPFKQAADGVDVDRMRQEKQASAEEVKLRRELAQELIDLGYRALAMRLHPDRGGSHEAMKRLSDVRDELKSIAENRRFV